jgi:hypothetical protein
LSSSSGTTPRTLKFERKSSKNRSAIGSDEEIEDNISYVEDNSKVFLIIRPFLFKLKLINFLDSV